MPRFFGAKSLGILSPSLKSKSKITPFGEVICVRILWLGFVGIFQIFDGLESVKDNETIQAICQVVDDELRGVI
jgi:hypothetical protein